MCWPGDSPFRTTPPRSACRKDAHKGPLLFDDLPPSSSADSGMGALCSLMGSHQPAVMTQVRSCVPHQPLLSLPSLGKATLQPLVLHTQQG
uniref:Uncharacterized protein n=1 Tax=Zosterops lateralis melanops TaxID=1220523 RepID=A0A8D2PN53_ZOSLA